MSSDEKVLDFPRVEVTSEESARRVMVEATRLARLAPGEWRLWTRGCFSKSHDPPPLGRSGALKVAVAAAFMEGAQQYQREIRSASVPPVSERCWRASWMRLRRETTQIHYSSS